ncbi:MAG: Trk system potassium transporter TrkA [Deltaproteobacteria bacterium]|nr:Trk system potassium transporter TrkA [Deltaproteobacteria bacterium]
MSILIIGGGEIGQFIAEQLITEKKEVIIIEKDERVIDEIEESLDVKFVLGNGAAPHILQEAGLSEAEMVIAVTNSDEANLLATILAGMEAPQAIRIARIRNPEFDIEEEKLQENLRIDLLINPDKEAARAIRKVLQVPGAFDTLDFFDGGVKIVGTKVKRESPLIDRKLKDLNSLRDDGHFLVAAIIRNNELIVPRGNDSVQTDDVVYFAADSQYTTEGMKLLGYKRQKIDDIMIFGGGYIGRNLASALEKRGANVKLIESDPQLCSVCSRNLDKSVILNAQGTDQEVLQEENIQKMDAFIAVTKDDEDNIISSLLAKRMGCPFAIALSHKSSYQALISSIGIDVVINPRQISNNRILHFIRKGKVLHVSMLQSGAEIIEVEALATSALVGQPIHKMKLPLDVLVLSIKRNGKITVPWGNTIIEPGDHVLLMARREAVPKLEKFLTVTLEYF